MEQLEIIRDVLVAVAIALGYLGAVLVLALVDAGFTLLLMRAARIFRRESALPQPGVPLPQLPDDHRAVVVGGSIRKWE
jgi:hypothetical protein